MVEIPRCCRCQSHKRSVKESQIQGVGPAQEKYVAHSKVVGVGLSKPFEIKVLTSDVELQNLAFILLGFGLALIQYFFTPIPSFWNSNLCSVLLHIANM